MKLMKSNWKSLVILMVPVILLVAAIVYNVVTVGTSCYLVTM
jgi:hypothetical protein